MAPTATKPKTLTPETLKEFCEKHPAYQNYRGALAKKHELVAQLLAVEKEINECSIKFQQAHDAERSEKLKQEKYDQFIDSGIKPKTSSIFEDLEENKRSLQDRQTLLRGAIDRQEKRIMLAKNDWQCLALKELRPLFLDYFRELLAEQFRVYRFADNVPRLRDEIDNWDLPSHVFQGLIPGFRYIGQATDFYSGMRAALRELRGDGIITDKEEEHLCKGGEFTP